MQWVALVEKNLKFRETEAFILGIKRACPSLKMKIISPSFKAVQYTNILGRIVWKKGRNPDRNIRDPWRIVS